MTRKLATVLVGGLTVLAALILAGCETAAPISTDAACGIFKSISYSRKDTGETVSQIVSHNAAGVAACGWKKP